MEIKEILQTDAFLYVKYNFCEPPMYFKNTCEVVARVIFIWTFEIK